MNWKENKAKLLNELGQAHGLYEHAKVIEKARDEGAPIDLRDGRWSHICTSLLEDGRAYRVSPAWLDAKISEQEAEEAKDASSAAASAAAQDKWLIVNAKPNFEKESK